MTGRAPSTLLAVLLSIPTVAHPPDCPGGRNGDHCRDLAIHAEHPNTWDCPDDEGAARQACLAEAAKWDDGRQHPAIWSCSQRKDGDNCRNMVREGRDLGYEVADGDCNGIWGSGLVMSSLARATGRTDLADFILGLTEAVFRERCGGSPGLRPLVDAALADGESSADDR